MSQLFRPGPSRAAVSIVPVLLALAWVLAWYVQVALQANPDFDGALNLNVSASLVEGSGYGSFYERFALFPIETQTNGPLVIPAAVSIAALGTGPLGLQLVNLLYVFAFAGLVVLLLRRVGAGWAWGGIGALAVLQVPGMSQFAMFGYGEVAALAWGLAAAWVLAGTLQRPLGSRVLLGGVLLGLSFLTKTVAMLWFPGVAGVFVLAVWSLHGFREAFRAALLGSIGVLIALTSWELYRLISLGGLSEWVGWWSTQYEEIRRQAGVREHYADTDSTWGKLALHGSSLAGYLGLPAMVLVGLGLVWASLMGGAIWLLRQRIAKLYPVLLVAGTAIAYLVWWLLITPTEMMWLRRIMLGLVLVQIGLSMAAVVLSGSGRAGRLAAWACAACMAVVAWQGQLLVARPDRAAAAASERAFADAVRELPKDALTFGSGWWQAPVVALLSGRRMHNEEAWTQQRLEAAGVPAFLVVDSYAQSLGTHLHWRMGWRCDCVPVHLSQGGRIYRIQRLFESEAESDFQRRRIGPESVGFGPGFSAQDEGGFRWAEQMAQLNLDPPASPSRWVVALAVPAPELFGRPQGSLLSIELERPGCATETHQLAAGEHSILLQACSAEVASLVLRASHRLDPQTILPDTRPLSLLFRSLELYPDTSEAGPEHARP